MATIKSFTDFEQSKKLAEILPLESADMVIVSIGDRYGVKTVVMPKETFDIIKTPFADIRETTMCWSLAALLGVIPQEIFDGEYIINITEGCDNRWVLTYDHFENRNHSYYSLSIGADNLIDACVAIIEKLHELKML